MSPSASSNHELEIASQSIVLRGVMTITDVIVSPIQLKRTVPTCRRLGDGRAIERDWACAAA